METMVGGSALETLLCVFWLASTLPIAAGLPIPVAGGGHTVRRLICAILACPRQDLQGLPIQGGKIAGGWVAQIVDGCFSRTCFF